jgi:signal transduction histidine kinase
MTSAPAPRRPRRSSVRARIAIACGGLFLVLGGILIAATYGQVGHAHPQGAAVAIQNPGQALSQRNPKLYDECLRFGDSATLAQHPGLLQECGQELQQAGAAEQAGADRREFLGYSLAGLALGTVLAGGLGWAVSGRVLRPLRAITEAARTASQESLLQRRLALAGPPDELKELADTFDAMLARLDGAFASQRRFVANASHELRTPLTEMRTLIEVTLAKPVRSAAQLELVLAGVRAAVDKSEELIEALLTLARSDRGLEDTEVVDLPTAVEDAIDLIGPAAAARHVSIDTALAPVQVAGDRILLERLVSNLIDNAVRHNVTGGWVLASTRHEGGHAELTFANGGEPIPADQASGLFEPFHRLSGRAGSRSGTGLGLSIVASVASAHGGRAEARALPDGGLEVQVRLPATASGGAGDPALGRSRGHAGSTPAAFAGAIRAQ